MGMHLKKKKTIHKPVYKAPYQLYPTTEHKQTGEFNKLLTSTFPLPDAAAPASLTSTRAAAASFLAFSLELSCMTISLELFCVTLDPFCDRSSFGDSVFFGARPRYAFQP